MIDVYPYLIDKVYQHIIGPKIRKGRSLNFRCPVCGDSKKDKSKKRGWITINSKTQSPSYHCWNCDTRMSAYAFIAFLENKSIQEIKKEFWALHKEDMKNILVPHIEEKEIEETENKIIQYGDSWIPWDQNIDSKIVIESRKILEAPFIPQNWKLYYDKKTNRIAIPWIRDGQMTYYQLRALGSSPQKYLFPPDTKKDVFGLDSFDESFPYVFYCEGVFDCIFIKNALAIGGLHLTEYQKEIIKNKVNIIENHVMFFDNQWTDLSSMNESIKQAKLGKNIFVWPKEIKEKDVNEYVINHNSNPFSDKEFLKNNTYSGMVALMKLKFKR